MRKIYITAMLVFIVCMSPSLIFAQKTVNSSQVTKRSILQSTSSIVAGTTSDCDTINYPVDPGWTSGYYTFNGGAGYLNGTNLGLDKQKGNYFDLSATANGYLSSVFISFGNANSSVPANMSKKIRFRVYGDNSGEPGTLLATEERTLTQIKADVDAQVFTQVDFTNPVTLPASKKFYVTVDFSNFTWPTDTAWVISTFDGEDVPGQAWEQWGPYQGSTDTSWHSVSEVYGLELTFWIFPSVSTSSTGCSVLPVKLLSFNAQRNNKDVTLNWQIADEYNMKGYEVQRADNNGTFKTVINVSALNNAKNQSYSVTDKNAFTSASTVQYRLKQIDGDGSVKYSRVIAIKANAIISDITFANPFNGALRLQLNLATAQNISVQLFDMKGKPVVSQLNKMYGASSNSIVLDGTSSLKPGMYILKINAGSEQVQYKIVKQ